MNSHDEIAKKSRGLFEHSVGTLDVATVNRLRLMRRDTLSQQAPSRFKAFLLPVSAAFAIALGVAVFLPQMQAGKAINEQESLYISVEDEAEADTLTWLADAPVEISSQLRGSL